MPPGVILPSEDRDMEPIKLSEAFPPDTKFGLVGGKPWTYEEPGAATFDWSTGAPVRASGARFREDADFASEADFRRAIATSHAGK